MESDDPTDIRVLAVTADDVVTAIEANERRGVGAVLRVTPPFSGRMRARLHREGGEHDYDDPTPIHIPADRFVDTVPPFPSPDDTEDEIRSERRTMYSRERHRDRHATAVEAWRTRVRESILASVSIPTPGGAHEVRVAALG